MLGGKSTPTRPSQNYDKFVQMTVEIFSAIRDRATMIAYPCSLYGHPDTSAVTSVPDHLNQILSLDA